MVKLLAVTFAAVTAGEIARFLFPRVNAKMVKWFKGIHREGELQELSGIFWLHFGFFVTVYLLPDRGAVLCGMGYLIFGDSAAALVGMRWGRHKILGKSVEGSLAFICAGTAVGMLFVSPVRALVGAAVGAIAELVPLPGNDNFWIPVVSAGVLTWVMR